MLVLQLKTFKVAKMGYFLGGLDALVGVPWSIGLLKILQSFKYFQSRYDDSNSNPKKLSLGITWKSYEQFN